MPGLRTANLNQCSFPQRRTGLESPALSGGGCQDQTITQRPRLGARRSPAAPAVPTPPPRCSLAARLAGDRGFPGLAVRYQSANMEASRRTAGILTA
jgi:hypothetical protein